ncbi:amino acid ABC transporter permease [Sporolactobacillus shoreicorticis]|uniref:Amino acid ABC transporter permease n=1 Tax=Sporolactobacillus shoreicorticis TaxID=1923877 RepID=A0ABW5S1F7_9BACL|nr:amino acid ABC transporter permease [Sporolactobacillus shoreicorticis]MCO7126531.1 amino acid ABC transporter permease [Sporolactobacillus shoreicorticis]
MDIAYFFKILPHFISALPITLIVIFFSQLFGLLLSIAVTYIQIKSIKVLTPLAHLYISFVRSTPILLQLLLIYYGLPVLLSLFGININFWSKTAFSIVTLVLHNGGFLSEVLRPAYLAVEQGQHEAADSLGFTSFQKLRRIIIPQLLPIALPGLGNGLIYLIHDTSILFVIGVVDVMGVASNLVSSSYGTDQIEVYLAVAFVYWAVTYLSDKGVKRLEKITERYHLENGLKS